MLMKSKILLIIFLATLSFKLSAQPLHWKESLFDPAKTSTIEKETVNKTDGLSSLKYTYTDPGIVLYMSDLFPVTAGLPWSFSVDYLDNDPKGIITARVYFMIDATTQVTPNSVGRFTTANTVDGANWQTLTLPAVASNIPSNATMAYVAIRMSPGTGFPSATFLADNVKFFQGTGSTTNLILNSSFEDWSPKFKLESLNPAVTGITDPVTHTVNLTVPFGTSVASLVPTISLLPGETISPLTGVAQDFTSPKTYTVTPSVGSPQDWVVTVNVTPAATGKDITSFKFEGLTPNVVGQINATAHTVALEVPFETNVTTLVPTITISTFATISPLSGVVKDFTNPQTYTITAQDGSTQDWVVTVTKAAPKYIETFTFEGLTPTVIGVVDPATLTVTVTVPFGTNVTALVPTITSTAGTTVSPLSGVVQDFTNPVTYKVIAGDASYKDWIVTVNITPPTTGKDILTFKFEGLSPKVTGTVNSANHTVALTVPYSTILTTLVPTITLSPNSTVSPLSGVANDFTNPATYTVTAQDGSTQAWIVTVTKAAPSSEKEIYSFKFEGLTPAVSGTILSAKDSIKLVVPQGTNVTALVPTIVLSTYATVSPLSGVANNFSTPQAYTVTAQDGSTRAWKVEVKFGTLETVLFFEDFENKKVIPSTFKLIKNDTYTMAAGEERWKDSTFVISTTSRKELLGTQVAMASTYCSDMPLTGHADRWMILPSIALGDNSILSWQAMSTTSSGNYPDDYDVIIAPAGAQGVQPTVAYFQENGNILKEVDPEKWSAYVSRIGEGLATHSINLKNTATVSQPNGWYNKTVWIAFVCNTDRYTNPTTGIPNSSAGGSALAIDNIKVVNKISTSIYDNINNTLEMSIYPNPTNGKFIISVPFEKRALAKIMVTDIIGRVIYKNQVSINAGQNQVDVNLSKIHGGIYFVKTEVEGKTNVSKIIVR